MIDNILQHLNDLLECSNILKLLAIWCFESRIDGIWSSAIPSFKPCLGSLKFLLCQCFWDPKWSISWIFYFVHVVSTFGTSGHGFMASAFRTTDGVKWPRHCVVQRQCRWLLRVPWFLDRHLVVATDVPRNIRKKTKPLKKLWLKNVRQVHRWEHCNTTLYIVLVAHYILHLNTIQCIGNPFSTSNPGLAIFKAPRGSTVTEGHWQSPVDSATQRLKKHPSKLC